MFDQDPQLYTFCWIRFRFKSSKGSSLNSTVCPRSSGPLHIVTYQVTQKLPQICTANYATFPIQIRKMTVQIDMRQLLGHQVGNGKGEWHNLSQIMIRSRGTYISLCPDITAPRHKEKSLLFDLFKSFDQIRSCSVVPSNVNTIMYGSKV